MTGQAMAMQVIVSADLLFMLVLHMCVLVHTLD